MDFKKLFVFVLMGLAPLAAQTPTATITGIVKDSSGAAIPEARVSVCNTGTNMTHDTLTSKNGEYTVPLLPLGQYELRLEAPIDRGPFAT